jgi:hypothetical protein
LIRIDLKGNTVNDKEEGLDKLLGELAARYDMQVPPAGALERLKRRLKTEGRTLSDNDLNWLAAAGEGPAQAPPVEDDEDPKLP